MLCVVAAHALFFYAWQMEGRMAPRQRVSVDVPPMQLLFLTFDEREFLDEDSPEPEPVPRLTVSVPPAVSSPPAASSAITTPAPDAPADTSRGFIDWQRETRESAARVLEQEREAERIAKMFAGPDGTWASLTKRQRSKVSKFKWKPGVEGLERDEDGNTIYRMPNGCTLVNFMFFGCPIGAKEKVNDDMFENMRLYFDEQRLPQTPEGNGTEPETRRRRW